MSLSRRSIASPRRALLGKTMNHLGVPPEATPVSISLDASGVLRIISVSEITGAWLIVFLHYGIPCLIIPGPVMS